MAAASHSAHMFFVSTLVCTLAVAREFLRWVCETCVPGCGAAGTPEIATRSCVTGYVDGNVFL